MSHQADLTTPAGLTAYLASTPYAAAHVQKLSGGQSGFVYRVALKSPVRGHTTVVVKHGRGYLAWDPSIAIRVDRMRFEFEALECLARASLFTPESIVQVPRVLEYDPEACALIMTDASPARTLSAVLTEACESGTVASLSARIGAALGEFMGRFHRWSADPAQLELRTRFLANETSKEEILCLRHDWMIDTAEKYGLRRGWMDEMVEDGMEDAKRGGSVIAMGDFWFENILVSTEPELRIFIINWETARCARPELDVAELAAEEHSLHYIHPSCDLRLMQSFMRYYRFPLDEIQIAFSAGRDVMSFGVMATCMEGKGERAKKEIAQRGLALLEAGRRGDRRGVRASVVVRGMYKY